MFPDDKIIEIFSMCDDFSKNFDDIIQKNSIDARDYQNSREIMNFAECNPEKS